MICLIAREPDRPFNELAETAQQEEPVRSYQGPLDFPEVLVVATAMPRQHRAGPATSTNTPSCHRSSRNTSALGSMILLTCQWGRSGLWAAEMGVSVSLGLVNRVFQYASADVAMVKLKGESCVVSCSFISSSLPWHIVCKYNKSINSF